MTCPDSCRIPAYYPNHEPTRQTAARKTAGSGKKTRRVGAEEGSGGAQELRSPFHPFAPTRTAKTMAEQRKRTGARAGVKAKKKSEGEMGSGGRERGRVGARVC